MSLSTIEDALSALRRGEPLVVVDDFDRENEGDLILPAEMAIRLMSNNPLKFRELEGYQIRIIERVSLLTRPTAENYAYLWAKQVRLGHCLNLTEAPSGTA